MNTISRTHPLFRSRSLSMFMIVVGHFMYVEGFGGKRMKWEGVGLLVCQCIGHYELICWTR